MLRDIRILVLLAAAALALSGCAAMRQGGWAADTDTVRLSEIDGGTTVTLEQTEKLVVTLRQTPGDCDEWDFEELDEDVLKMDRYNFLADQPGVACSGGDMILYFHPVAPGTAHVRLTYARGWIEKEREFEIWVVVR